MTLEKFTASTIATALAEVKRRLGPDAVIYETRTLTQKHWWGLRRRELVEVTAGKGPAVSRRTPPGRVPQRAPVTREVAAPRAQAAYAEQGARVEQGGAVARENGSAVLGARKLLETPAAQSVALLNYASEINGLRSMMKQLVDEVRQRSAPQVPEELFDFYTDLLSAEVSEELAADIVRKIKQHARSEQLSNRQWVRERVIEHIEKLIPISGPIERKKASGPHVVALVGPTGVGKTTTIAKLAANLKLREGRSVGLITLDTYRIAAIEQLRKYAELIGVLLQVVSRPDDLPEALASVSDCDYVLIDTAGRSPSDGLKISELEQFIAAAKPDEVHLVLSTTCSARSAQHAAESFSRLAIDKVIFTKIDEAAQLGVMLSVVRKLNKGLSYVTTGQDVPDDIEVSQARKLAQIIVGSK